MAVDRGGRFLGAIVLGIGLTVGVVGCGGGGSGGAVTTTPSVPAPSSSTSSTSSTSTAVVTSTSSTAVVTSTTGSATVPTVAVFGDSLTMESGREIDALAAAHGYRVTRYARSGQTPCDGLAGLDEVVAGPPTIVVFAYVGNNHLYSGCLGSDGQTVAEADARYRELLTSMAARASAAGSKVGFLGGPAWPGNDLAAEVYDTVRSIADERGDPFVDGGRYVTPDRTWSATVPCEPDEPGCTDGRIAVHLAGTGFPEDVHFDCASPGYALGENVPCPVRSAGGHRFALALDDLIRDLGAS